MVELLRGLIHAIYSDRRANRLDRLEIRRIEGRLECVAAGPREAARQIEAGLGPCDPVVLDRAEGMGSRWTDAWALSREPGPELIKALDFMKTVLYLRVQAPVEAAVALDWYKQPPDDGDGFDDTRIGKAMNAAKYRAIDEARAVIVNDLVRVIDHHPTYKNVASIISVPGSTPTSLFSLLLAHEVGDLAGLPVVDARRVGSERSPAKAAEDDSLPVDLDECFEIDPSLAGMTVCIVDDVFRRGLTMRGVGHAVIRAGADHCLGLVAARTLRSVV